MEWFNEPPGWSANENWSRVTVRAGGRTDFWRKTHDGGVRDSGHFAYRRVTGDFVAQVHVAGAYGTLYDQAGLMVRQDERVWLKCGIELFNGLQQASAVVTHEWSDWSVLPLGSPPAIDLRVVRHGATVEVYFALEGSAYTLIRQAYLSEAPELLVGLMCAAPTGEGFDVVFQNFRTGHA